MVTKKANIRISSLLEEGTIASLSGLVLGCVYKVLPDVNRKVIDSQNRNENSQIVIHSYMKHLLGPIYMVDAT